MFRLLLGRLQFPRQLAKAGRVLALQNEDLVFGVDHLLVGDLHLKHATRGPMLLTLFWSIFTLFCEKMANILKTT
jgi:hypothetical protein